MSGPVLDPMAHTAGEDADLNALAAFVDGRSSESERAVVREHLASCARCRTVVGELTQAGASRPAPLGWSRAALPLAASILIALGGGGLYLITRPGTAPAAVAPAAPSPAAAPAPPSAIDRPDGRSSSPANTTPAPSATRRPQPPADRTRSAETKSVAGKTFRLVAGEWVDVDYRVADVAAVVDIRTPDAFGGHERLRPFAGLGRRFTVVLDDTAYRVDLPPR